MLAAGIAPAGAGEERPTLRDLEDEVMCPVCETTLSQSNSPAAQQIERFIARRIRAGDTRSEIEAKLVADYGPAVLAAPPKRGFDLLAWLLPLAAAAVGALALGVLAWRWSRTREHETTDPARLDPALERRVDDALATFE